MPFAARPRLREQPSRWSRLAPCRETSSGLVPARVTPRPASVRRRALPRGSPAPCWDAPALLVRDGPTPFVLEDASGRAQELLLPGVILDRVEALATAEVGDFDVGLHAGQDDPQFVGRGPRPTLPILADRWSFSSSSS
jgi:hypothetical protein